MDNGLIPGRYAKALYKYASEHGDAKALYSLVKTVILTFEDNQQLKKVLANPFVTNNDKEKLLLAAAGNVDNDDYNRFVKLLVDNGRTDYAFQSMVAYRDLYRKEHHISQAHLTTASSLSSEQMNKLRKLVTDSFKDSEIEFTESVNPSLIGGFVIDVDSVKMDASLSNELEQLRQTLLRSK